MPFRKRTKPKVGIQVLTAQEFHDFAHWSTWSPEGGTVLIPLEEMRAALEKHEIHRDTIDQLEAELRKDGGFHTPIALDRTGDILNGRHRYCALKRTNSPSYFVKVGSLPDCDIAETARISMYFEYLGEPFTEDLDTYAANVIISIKSNENWYDWSSFGGFNTFSYSGEAGFSEHLIPAMIRKLERFGIRGTLIACEVVDADE
jgi:hypothetical protein